MCFLAMVYTSKDGITQVDTNLACFSITIVKLELHWNCGPTSAYLSGLVAASSTAFNPAVRGSIAGRVSFESLLVPFVSVILATLRWNTNEGARQAVGIFERNTGARRNGINSMKRVVCRLRAINIYLA